MTGYAFPRLVITDALGRRSIPIERAVLTVGRRSECDVRLTGADVSRQHAELLLQGAQVVLRDCGSKFGTFVNGERITERELRPGDAIGLGQTSDTSIVFAVGDSEMSGEYLAASAATELRHMAALLEGLRALGSGRVLEEVLALVLDSAIEVTGAERGFIMLANTDQQLELKLVRARGKMTLGGGAHLRDQPQDSRDGVLDGSTTDRRGPARWRPGQRPRWDGRPGHPTRLVRAAAAHAVCRARRLRDVGPRHWRAVPGQPGAPRADLLDRASVARNAERGSGHRDRECPLVSGSTRQSEDRARAEACRQHSTGVAAPGEPQR